MKKGCQENRPKTEQITLTRVSRQCSGHFVSRTLTWTRAGQNCHGHGEDDTDEMGQRRRGCSTVTIDSGLGLSLLVVSHVDANLCGLRELAFDRHAARLSLRMNGQLPSKNRNRCWNKSIHHEFIMLNIGRFEESRQDESVILAGNVT